MPSLSKPALRGMPPVKKAVLIALLLAVIALGFFLGAFVNYRLHNKSYSATFVAIEPLPFPQAF